MGLSPAWDCWRFYRLLMGNDKAPAGYVIVLNLSGLV